MNIRLLQCEEIPLIWQIDRPEVVQNIYVLQDGQLVVQPDYFEIQGWPPDEEELYTPYFWIAMIAEESSGVLLRPHIGWCSNPRKQFYRFTT